MLTPLPQEQHGLGLLMAEAMLSLEACTCISLGTQTPLTDIAKASRAHSIDVVALSFSSALSSKLALASLKELRAALPKHVALWAGGSCKGLDQKPIEGVSSIQQFSSLPAMVQAWRSSSPSQ